MKELQIKPKPDIIQEVKTPERTETVLVDQLTPRRGHTCFEYNIVTGSIREAEFEKIDVNVSFTRVWGNGKSVLVGHADTNKRITRQPNCIYVTALNIQNLKKKLGIK
jgi:hypothetical protein